MGGRFGKYGDHKRRENLKKGRLGAQTPEKIKGKTGKSVPRPALKKGLDAVKTGPGAP